MTNNSAHFVGGGMMVSEGLHIQVTASGNTAGGRGGGVFVREGDIVVSHFSITDNQAGAEGGGMFITDGGHADITDSVICGNTADQLGNEGTVNGHGLIVCDDDLIPLGACCLPSGDCVRTTPLECAQAGGDFGGLFSVCESQNCEETCPEDFDGNGNVDVNDLLRLLAAWGGCL